jgi:uncharacterized Zn-finger protein
MEEKIEYCLKYKNIFEIKEFAKILNSIEVPSKKENSLNSIEVPSKKENSLNSIEVPIKKEYRNQGICKICNKTYARLARHLSTHFKEKIFLCNICNRSFNRKDNLKKHLLLHTGAKKLEKCNICNRSFTRLGRHIVLHFEDKPYLCDICNKSFSRVDVLKRHKALHIGEKKYHQCEICNKSFSRVDVLKRHKLSHIRKKNLIIKVL